MSIDRQRVHGGARRQLEFATVGTVCSPGGNWRWSKYQFKGKRSARDSTSPGKSLRVQGDSPALGPGRDGRNSRSHRGLPFSQLSVRCRRWGVLCTLTLWGVSCTLTLCRGLSWGFSWDSLPISFLGLFFFNKSIFIKIGLCYYGRSENILKL